MGPTNNHDALNAADLSPGSGNAGLPGASPDAMDAFNVADTLGTADESIGQIDATDQNELEWNAGAQPGDTIDTRSSAMSDMPMNTGDNTRDTSQESITQAFENGDIQRGEANLNPTNAEAPATPVHDPFDPSQNVDRSNDANYAKDPVCGTWVDKRTATNTLPAPVNMPMDTLYFDSPECKALFEEDPAKYGSNF